MTPLEILREAAQLGVQLVVRAGVLGASPPGRVPAELRARIAETKPALLEALAAPRKTAYRTWESATEEIAIAWTAHAVRERAAGREPHELEADEVLSLAVKTSILTTTDGETLVKALEAIATWRKAWMLILIVEVEPVAPVERVHQCELFAEASTSTSETAREYRGRTKRAAAGERRPA